MKRKALKKTETPPEVDSYLQDAADAIWQKMGRAHEETFEDIADLLTTYCVDDRAQEARKRLDEIRGNASVLRDSVVEAMNDEIIFPEPEDVLNEMQPSELGERIARLMEQWSSVDLDAFKRHLGHALYPLNPNP